MKFKLAPVAAAVVAAYAGLYTTSASAVAVSNESVIASYTVTGSPSANQTGANVAAISSVDAFADPSGPSYGFSIQPGAFFYGDVAANVFSAASQAGAPDGYASPEVWTSTALSSVTYRVTYTNDASSTQAYTFNFLLNGGSLGLVAPWAGAIANASFVGSVKVNSTQVWNTSATLTDNSSDWVGESPFAFSYSGVNIGYGTPGGGLTAEVHAGFGPYTGAVFLGNLAAGQSVDVEYTLQTAATVDGVAWYGGAYSYINDPTGMNGVGVTVTAVPEPETVALMAAGLTLLAARTRRRKAK